MSDHDVTWKEARVCLLNLSSPIQIHLTLLHWRVLRDANIHHATVMRGTYSSPERVPVSHLTGVGISEGDVAISRLTQPSHFNANMCIWSNAKPHFVSESNNSDK